MSHPPARALLHRMFQAAVASADPAKTLARHLPERPKGRIIVVGAGKSAASMARAVEMAWPDADLSGLVVTRYGHSVPTDRIEVVEAAHPVPDANGLRAAERIMGMVRDLHPDDLVLALMSGGGSSLLPLPVPGLTLADKQEANRRLLRSGLPIDVMNRVRRRLSAIKGGGLARAAFPATVVTLAISDVPGDDPLAIASGPTVPDPDPDAGRDLADVIAALGPDLPQNIRDRLLKAPEPQAPFQADYRLIASPIIALCAAADVAREAGVAPLILGDALEGEASALGIAMAGMTQSVLRHGQPIARPAVLISGGETTVTLTETGGGRGGRNTEFLLALATALPRDAEVWAIACDTDGIDGSEDAAGAIITPDTMRRADAAKLDAASCLTRHDSYGFFDALADLVTTGPTLTNVNDFRAILVR